ADVPTGQKGDANVAPPFSFPSSRYVLGYFFAGAAGLAPAAGLAGAPWPPAPGAPPAAGAGAAPLSSLSAKLTSRLRALSIATKPGFSTHFIQASLGSTWPAST